MATLTKYIYNYQGTDLGRIRTRAMLCHIYHYALHNRWYQARDLMMMSHLQEAIHLADVPTQVATPFCAHLLASPTPFPVLCSVTLVMDMSDLV